MNQTLKFNLSVLIPTAQQITDDLIEAYKKDLLENTLATAGYRGIAIDRIVILETVVYEREKGAGV